MNKRRILTLFTAIALALAACGSGQSETAETTAESSTTTETATTSEAPAETEAPSDTDAPAETEAPVASEWTPITVEHVFGSTTIDERPERVATIDYANQDVVLALGVVPVGMPEMTWGDDDGDGLHAWVKERLDELGAETPPFFDETDGYDFEAIAGVDPDLIVAGYSGMSEDDYNTLNEIAPVVPYPAGESPWSTPWRENIRITSQALGMADEGESLIADLEAELAEVTDAYPAIDGAIGMFLTHVDTTDLSEIRFYSANDTRVKFLEDLGMQISPAVVAASTPGEYGGSMSTEQADSLADVDVMVTYGGAELVDAVTADPVMSLLPAIGDDGAGFVHLDGAQSMGAAANPTALSIPWVMDAYAELLAAAVEATANNR